MSKTAKSQVFEKKNTDFVDKLTRNAIQFFSEQILLTPEI